MLAPTPTIERLQKKWEKEPNSMIFMQLAEELRKQGQHNEALRVCQDGLGRHPNYWSARVILGRIYKETGAIQQSREELEKVIKAVPDNLLANKLLGDIYMQLNMDQDALSRYKLVQMFTPSDREVLSHVQALEARISSASAPDVSPFPPDAVPTPLVEEPAEFTAPTLEVAVPQPMVALEPALPGEEAQDVESSSAPTLPLKSPDIEEVMRYGQQLPSEPLMAAPAVDLLPPEIVPSEQPDPALAEIATILLEGEPRDEAAPQELLPVIEKQSSSSELTFRETDVMELEPDWEAEKELLESQDRTQPIVEEEQTGGESVEEADELTTQTLAELYERQGLVDKAVRVYQKLLLNDPANEQIIQKLRELSPVDSLLAATTQEEEALPEEKPQSQASPRVRGWEEHVEASAAGAIARLSQERRRKITTLENWLASIRRERS